MWQPLIRRRMITCFTILPIVLCMPAGAQTEVAELLASDGQPGDELGVGVDISGDIAIVGAYFDDDNGDASGSAFVFRSTDSVWSQEMKLLPSDGAAGDQFGLTAAARQDVVLVGAQQGDGIGPGTGAAYVFRFNGSTWIQEQKLFASDGFVGDLFSRGVALGDDIAVVGAFRDDDNGSQSGSAYVFRFDGSTWVEEAKLLPSDGAAVDNFGISVAVDGNVVLVGSYRDDDNGNQSGSAYVFRFDGSTWLQEQKLLALDGTEADNFGLSVALSADTALIGARVADGLAAFTGAAYVFRFDGLTWVQEQKLVASDGALGDEFGYAVALTCQVAVVGSRLDDNNGQNAGSAYVFRFDGSTWVEVAELLASDGAARDQAGVAVGSTRDRAVLGAPFHQDNGPSSGSGYIFEGLLPCPTDVNGDCTVNVLDLIDLLLMFGMECTCCPEDVNGDGVVNVLDLIELLLDFGTLCPCALPAENPPKSLEEELSEAGLTMDDWEDFEDVMKGNDPEEKDNWKCWMTHYLQGCPTSTGQFCGGPACPDDDPFNKH